MTLVKICGLKDAENIKAAVGSGADFIGFVFYAPSPRFITPENAKKLSALVPPHVKKVGLFVNASDTEIAAATSAIDMIQIHGDETPARAAEIKARFGLPVIKAIRIGGAEDIKAIDEFQDSADWILVDAHAESRNLGISEISEIPRFRDSVIPIYGGTGHSFDWNLLRGIKFKKPWMLSGGLNADNVKDAILTLKPTAVDVSSGVETARGIKDSSKIHAFIDTVKKL